ncbi:MAG: DUF6788 family protein [Candidatus Binatia bacterium]
MKDLVRRRNALLRKFEQCSGFVRGSVNSVCAKCNRARCICDKKTSRRAYRLTYKDSQQKTRIVYVPRNRLPEIRRMIANYSRSRKIMEQLIETNLDIFKKGSGC